MYECQQVFFFFYVAPLEVIGGFRGCKKVMTFIWGDIVSTFLLLTFFGTSFQTFNFFLANLKGKMCDLWRDLQDIPV